MRWFLVILLGFAAGCAHKREPAPADLDGASAWVFTHFEDDELLAEGMTNLAVWLDANATTEEAADGFVLSDLTEDAVADVNHPEGDLAVMIGVAVPGTSPFPIRDHAALLVMTDQIWNDETTYELYTREIVEGDPETFATGASPLARTRNDIDKKGAFGVHIPYILFKDYKWVTLEDGGEAIVGRSWIEEASCAEGGDNCLNQSFSIDLFYAPAGSDSTIRMTGSWNDLVTVADSVLSDEQRIGLMVKGIHDIFENTDEFLSPEED